MKWLAHNHVVKRTVLSNGNHDSSYNPNKDQAESTAVDDHDSKPANPSPDLSIMSIMRPPPGSAIPFNLSEVQSSPSCPAPVPP